MKVFCKANWDCSFSVQGTQLCPHLHLLPVSISVLPASIPKGFCLSSLARLPHPIYQDLLMMSLNKFWRHKVSLVETDSFLLEHLNTILGAASRCRVMPGTCGWQVGDPFSNGRNSGRSRNCLLPIMLWP